MTKGRNALWTGVVGYRVTGRSGDLATPGCGQRWIDQGDPRLKDVAAVLHAPKRQGPFYPHLAAARCIARLRRYRSAKAGRMGDWLIGRRHITARANDASEIPLSPKLLVS